TTFVPLRFISEAFGSKVEWQNVGKGRIIITLKEKIIILNIGSKEATINGTSYTLLAPPEIKNGRTFVPVRFISEGLGAEVLWNAQYQEVTIIYKP
ncbi:MAG: copper amine oxidase N-terminal domain-containing protein, partial [Caldisericia bacterium]|nr:copper amine oxidase N-terminal domain-containing protein [Caldisericia bacterium]